MLSAISTKDLQKARRNAERKRASIACARCKAGKTKCSDYRPCKKCKYSNMASGCTPQSADSRVSSDVSAHEWCMGNSPQFPPAPANPASDFQTRPGPAFGIDSSVPCFTGSMISWAAPGTASDSTAGTADLKNTASISARKSSKSGGSSQADRPMLGSHVSMVRSLFSNSDHVPSTGFLQAHWSHAESNRNLCQQIQNTQGTHRRTTPAFPPILSPPFTLLLTALQTLPPPEVAPTLIGLVTATTPRLMAPSIDSSLLLALLDAGAAPHPHRRLPPIAPAPLLFRR